MSSLLTDIRFALRTLARSPGFTAVAVATLALGIGANTATFSVVHGLLIRGLPLEDPDRLVFLFRANPSRDVERDVTSVPEFEDWRDQSTAFEHVAAINPRPANLTGKGLAPEAVSTAQVSPDFFAMLRREPELGRGFRQGEDAQGAAPVAVLSRGLWQRRFGGDPDIIGTGVLLDDRPTTVIGVMPARFDFPAGTDLWVPAIFPDGIRQARGNIFLPVMARLKDGVSLEQAQQQMATIAARLEREYPEENLGWTATAVPALEQLTQNYRTALLVLMGAVALVLLIACANVANLSLARATARRRELAVRAALGAGRGRVIRQMLTESLVLAGLGAGAGVLLAQWGVEALIANAPVQLPVWADMSVDGPVLFFSVAVTVLTGLLFGVLPAVGASSRSLIGGLRAGSRSAGSGAEATRAQSFLVTAQVALALVLLFGAGLLVPSFTALRSAQVGFVADPVLVASLAMPASRYEDRDARSQLMERLKVRLEADPRVRSVSAVSTLPLSGDFMDVDIRIPGQTFEAGQKPTSGVDIVMPDYFESMGIPLTAAGSRDFDERDRREAPKVAVINQVMANRFWLGEDPIGKVFMLGSGTAFEIVGVAGSVRRSSLNQVERSHFYIPFSQFPRQRVSLVVRAAGDPGVLAEDVRAAVRGEDPELPVSGLQPMTGYLVQAIELPRFNAQLLGIFALVAVGLAALGLYGVLAYTVSRRTPEIGVRMALGASRGDVLRLVTGAGLRLVFGGLAVGLVGALALGDLVGELLYEVPPQDPATLISVALLLLMVAAAASYFPARRAASVDPMVALRDE